MDSSNEAWVAGQRVPRRLQRLLQEYDTRELHAGRDRGLLLARVLDRGGFDDVAWAMRRYGRASVRASTLGLTVLLSAATVAGGALPAQALYLTEFLASNNTTIADEDLEFSDWMEIHNAAAVDVAGYYLTDNEEGKPQWVLPSVSIPAGGYLLVWASGKDRSDPLGELHVRVSRSPPGTSDATRDQVHTKPLAGADPFSRRRPDSARYEPRRAWRASFGSGLQESLRIALAVHIFAHPTKTVETRRG